MTAVSVPFRSQLGLRLPKANFDLIQTAVVLENVNYGQMLFGTEGVQ